MPVAEQRHVEAFIRRNTLTVDTFQAHRSGGSHAEYVVVAARRRGLRVERFGDGSYFYCGTTVVGGMRSMLSTLVSSVAVSVCADKDVTRSMLTAAGIPVPTGKAFAAAARDEARDYVQTLQAPVIVKPIDGSAGRGITCGVQTDEHLVTAWDHATAATRRGQILVERFVAGLDVRAFVVGDQVVAAATRLPAFVVGDGRSTVEELTRAKQEVRDRSAYLRKMPIVVDPQWLAENGHRPSTVPPPGEVVLLNPTVNLHQGGENVDITGQLCPELRHLAVCAAAAIPGLGAGGIDLIVQSPHTAEGAVVLEANTSANISVHHLPAYGTPVDVAGAIVEEMVRRSATGRGPRRGLRGRLFRRA